jgi:Ca2+/Na+ antiporter
MEREKRESKIKGNEITQNLFAYNVDQIHFTLIANLRQRKFSFLCVLIVIFLLLLLLFKKKKDLFAKKILKFLFYVGKLNK